MPVSLPNGVVSFSKDLGEWVSVVLDGPLAATAFSSPGLEIIHEV
jgi:hypothetical protein